jgi:asparagine synthase (glutamine-hydrolysing)
VSGLVGVVNFDGAPVDRALLSSMTNSLGFRGPDATRTWIDGAAGFGHTLLKATDESDREEQPFTLDGRTWIVADARVDGRRELVSKLRAKGCDVSLDRPDCEMILHAYRVWGEACLDHLLGDFAFAIWDGPRRRLFCARDHMGIKPFYYLHTGSTVVFSNTLDCIRLHPSASDQLNELAIADFLLFEVNQENHTTAFAGIQRIAPAHAATWSEAGMHLRRYWTLPVDEPIRYRRLDDYTDRFKELLGDAVNDRLRTDRVGVFMSGGIDSPTLAATASHLLKERSSKAELSAFTWVFDGIDQERHYASLVAKHLDIPIYFRDGNAEGIDPHWEERTFHTPEPPSNPLILAQDLGYYQRVSTHNRAVLYGEGPDTALHYEWRPQLRQLASRGQYGRLIRDVCSLMVLHKRIPLLATLPRMIRDRGVEQRLRTNYPKWLEATFQTRLDLPQRWSEKQRLPQPLVHPARPVSYAAIQGPQWINMFEERDSAYTRASLEFRYPYFDIRLLRYLLAVPALPWCRVKYLFRRAMRGALPEPVLRRPKAPLPRSPWLELSRRSGFQPFRPIETLRRFVDPLSVLEPATENLGGFTVGMRPRSLNYWLKNISVMQHN